MNGAVAVPLTEFPGTATYTCDTGYVLSGGNTRTCLANGMWSGIAPTCTGRVLLHSYVLYVTANAIHLPTLEISFVTVHI